MSSSLIDAALARAEEAVARGPYSEPAEDRPRPRRLVVGDPQVDLWRFFTVLERHGLLGGDGRLRPEVQLVCVGDCFDWGGAHEREAVARSGLRLVAWLAAHPEDQAVLLLGNHDLGRVGELVDFSDERFAQAQAEADQVYRGGHVDEALEQAFLARWPQVPSAELVARDFSAYREEQRGWVEWLLRAGRWRVAHAAAEDLLVLHAGVTREDLRVAGLAESAWASAPAVAEALNGALAAAVEAWREGPLVVPGLHVPGSAAYGEGCGIFYHRPSLLPEEEARRASTPRRRFDPRRLPEGLVQVVGHTRDKRTRELLGLGREGARDGVIRHLVTDGVSTHYAPGSPPQRARAGEAVLVFTDGGLHYAPPESIELFDLGTRAAVRPVG